MKKYLKCLAAVLCFGAFVHWFLWLIDCSLNWRLFIGLGPLLLLFGCVFLGSLDDD